MPIYHSISIGQGGYEFNAPTGAPPESGCALVAGSGSGTSYNLGWSARPVLIEPAVAEGSVNDYLSPEGWKSIPSSSVAVGDITGFGAGVAAFLATPSSANLATAVTDETGSGALVFANTPTLVTPNIGAATGNSLTLTGDFIAGTLGARIRKFGSQVFLDAGDGTGTYSSMIRGSVAAQTIHIGVATVGHTVTVSPPTLITNLIQPAADNTHDFGTGVLRWKDAHYAGIVNAGQVNASVVGSNGSFLTISPGTTGNAYLYRAGVNPILTFLDTAFGFALTLEGNTTNGSIQSASSKPLLLNSAAGTNVLVGGVVADATAKLSVLSDSTSKVVAKFKGIASQSANLTEWQNSSSAVLASVSAGGDGMFATLGTNQLNIVDGGSIVGFGGYMYISSPTGVWIDAPETSILTGTFNAGAATFTGAIAGKRAFFQSAGTTDVTLVAKAVASQTANVQEWQNSAGTLLGYMTTTTPRFVIGTVASGVALRKLASGWLGLYESTGTTLGTLFVGNAVIAPANTQFTSASTSTPTVIVTGMAAQSAPIVELRNSASAVGMQLYDNGNAVFNGTVSCPQNTSSERFGAGSNCADVLSVAIGNSASAGASHGVAIGHSAATTGAICTAIGYGAVGGSYASVAIGWGASSGWHGVAIGYGAQTSTAYGVGGVAIGRVAVAHDGSVALGAGAATTAAGQCVIEPSLQLMTGSTLSQGYGVITPSARSRMLATGQRISEVGDGAGAWQELVSEVYDVGGRKLGFNGATAIAKQTYTTGDGADALATLLHNLGLITKV